MFFFPCHVTRPQNNGKFCQGSSRLNQLCNTRPCPIPSVDFRAQQCAEYNSKPFRGWYYKWKPYTKVDGKTCQSWPKVLMHHFCFMIFISEYIIDYWFALLLPYLPCTPTPTHYGRSIFWKLWWPTSSPRVRNHLSKPKYFIVVLCLRG